MLNSKTWWNLDPHNRQRLYAGRPWQKVAIDLVGPTPETKKGTYWILVLTNRFTQSQDALTIPDFTVLVVATALMSGCFATRNYSNRFTQIKGLNSNPL